MRTISMRLVVVLCLAGVAGLEAQKPAPPARLFRPPQSVAIAGHYLVLLADQTLDTAEVPGIAAKLAQRYGGVLTHVYRNALKGFALRMPDEAAVRLSADPLVRFVQQNAQGAPPVPGGPAVAALTSKAAAGAAQSGGPQVSSISPKDGFPSAEIMVIGSALGDTGETTVLFAGGVAGLRLFSNTSNINVSVPNGAGTGPIEVRTSAGSATSTMPFLVRAPRALDRLDQQRLPRSCSYARPSTGTGVTAYVLDSGVSRSHDQFGGRVERVANCLNPDPATCEVGSQSVSDFHGTSVASLVAGRDVGVANGARVVSVQVYTSGRFDLADIVKGVDWTAGDLPAHRPAVVNLSLGFPAASDPMKLFTTAVERLTDTTRVLVVAAAPNTSGLVGLSSCDDDLAPIKDKVLMVGATTAADQQNSGYGPCLALFAPGFGSEAATLGSTDFTLGLFGGTSGAAPLVSGVAALYLQGHPAANAGEVRAAILQGATSGVVQNGGDAPNLLLSSRLNGGPPGAPTASPASLTFRVEAGRVSTPQTLTLGSTGGPLEVRVLASAPAVKLGGVPQEVYPDVCSPHLTTPAGIQVSIDATALTADTTATLTVQANDVSAPVTVPVTIQVLPSTLPRIDAFTPSAAPRKKVTITGVNLGNASRVAFNGVAANIKSNTPAQIVAKVPPKATSGFIVVTTPRGTASTEPRMFTVLPPVAPAIASFTPAAGLAGTPVTIVGTAFDDETTVTFNGIPATIVAVDETLLTVVVPAGAATGPIQVANPDGASASGTSFVVAPPPTIVSFTPASGPPGTVVTVDGTGFAGVTAVRFGPVAAAFTLLSPSRISTTVPGFATTGPIAVVTPGGTATSAASFVVTPVATPAPAITSFAPTSGSAGTLVAIQGNNLSGTTTVTFNGAAAAFTVSSPQTLFATVPTGATTGPIRVATPNGFALSTASFVVSGAPGPLITGFLPTSGPPGTTVNISGSNFTGVSTVSFGGVAGAFTVLGSGAITATVPGFAASGPIRVTTAAGTAMSAGSFTVTPLAGPVITSFSPANGPPGTGVTVLGANFSGTTAVSFGGVPATFAVQSPTTLTTTAPFGAVTGPIAVTTPLGSATSGTSFVVSTQPLPVIASFTPSSGPPATQVSISGINFGGVTNVAFGGVSAAFSALTPNLLTATVPGFAASGPISVTSSAGTATSAASFVVASGPMPRITSFLPASGPPGTNVSINGSGLSPLVNVSFNGVNAAFAGISDTLVTATVPGFASTGPVRVQTAAGTAVSDLAFTVTANLPPPSARSRPTRARPAPW